MERTLILFMATVVVFLTSGVQAQFTNAVNGTVNINRTGCGITKLCVDDPIGCDPAGSGACLFGSTKVKNLTISELSFQLSGNSTGYIALGLTKSESQGSTLLFACTQDATTNGTIFFQTLSRNNTGGNVTSLSSVNVTNIRGTVNGTKIQCEFDVAGLNSSSDLFTRSQETIFSMLLGSGTFQNGIFGPFIAQTRSALLDLSNPAANVATANTTASTNTTSPTGAGPAFHSDAVLLLTSVLTLTVLKAF